jgi:type I restriction enzyme M protein
MANPPFNVDDVDAEKIKNDRRLPFGLPGVNNKGSVSNGNYLWISYFYSYLNAKGRAGFVMSSQASSASGAEAEVRRKIIESGDVGVMMAIRGNFFYTRSVPCELWFFNRAKPKQLRDKVLMLDARNVYRKVTRKIYDFSPEQLQNLTAVVWLYRGEHDRFLKLVQSYLDISLKEAVAAKEPNAAFIDAVTTIRGELEAIDEETDAAMRTFEADHAIFEKSARDAQKQWGGAKRSNKSLHKVATGVAPLSETSRDLVKQIDQLYKFLEKLAHDSGQRGLRRHLKALDDLRKEAVEQLKLIRYFHRQAQWLQSRFPDAELCDVEGLVRIVSHEEIAENGWSLTPGRYVGVAREEEDEDFDFEEALRDVHIELKGLNEEASALAAQIKKNFEELGI